MNIFQWNQNIFHDRSLICDVAYLDIADDSVYSILQSTRFLDVFFA